MSEVDAARIIELLEAMRYLGWSIAIAVWALVFTWWTKK